MQLVLDERTGEQVCYASSPKWIVTSVTPRPDWSLLLTFVGGEKKIYDARPLLEDKYFEPLKDIGFFMLARVEYHTVVWNDDIDVAPEHLWEAGVSVPEEKASRG